MTINRILVLIFSFLLLGINCIHAEAAELYQPVQEENTPSEIAPFATYKIEQHSPDAAFRLREYQNYSGPVEGLASEGEAWTGFFRQKARDIIVDLGKLRTITQISLEFKQDSNSGILLPADMQGSISIDGESWSYLGKVVNRVSPSDKTVQNRNFILSFEPVTARYIKISFPVNVWVFARHLSIKSLTPVKEPAVLAPTGKNPQASGPYLQIPDINDILLIYSGPEHLEGTWTDKDFLPLVGYIDPVGVLKERMFDTMLFLPYGEMPCTKDSWTAYKEDLFASGKQLQALNKAAAKMNELPYIEGKEKVILTLPYPDVNQHNFGSLEDSNESLSFSAGKVGSEQALDNRFSALQWYYNQLLSEWEKANFEYLELAGIYWYQETLDQNTAGEEALLQKAARMVRDSGQKFFWIPFYGSGGYDSWQNHGFDYVFIQPNYYASDNPPEERMDRAAQLARQKHLGLELELDDRITYSRYYYDLFYKQLNKAKQLGLDSTTTNAYYAGTKTLLKSQRSKIPEVRAVYDDMFKWIKGTYGRR